MSQNHYDPLAVKPVRRGGRGCIPRDPRLPLPLPYKLIFRWSHRLQRWTFLGFT